MDAIFCKVVSVKHRINDKPENVIKAINNIVGYKAYRNREILRLHYVDGYTYEKIAEMMDLSDRHVKKICYDYEPIVIEYLRVED